MAVLELIGGFVKDVLKFKKFSENFPSPTLYIHYVQVSISSTVLYLEISSPLTLSVSLIFFSKTATKGKIKKVGNKKISIFNYLLNYCTIKYRL